MTRKLLNFLIFLPLGILLVVLSVTNRQAVTLALNPFQPEDGLLSVTAPLFALVLGALILGILLGSSATWISQARYRRQARRLHDAVGPVATVPEKLPAR